MMICIKQPQRRIYSPHFLAGLSPVDSDRKLDFKYFGEVTFRAVRPEDAAKIIQFHKRLLRGSLWKRDPKNLSHDVGKLREKVGNVCVNSEDSFSMVAERRVKESRLSRILALGRLTTTDEPGVAGLVLVTPEKVRDTGIAYELFERLSSVARASGFDSMREETLPWDDDILDFCRGFGLRQRAVPKDSVITVGYPL